MTTLSDAIVQDNIRRERQSRGQERVCADCGERGIVGDDIVAAHTIGSDGREWLWWIHRACADMRIGQVSNGI